MYIYIYILRLWNYINMHFTRLHAVIWPGHLKSAQPSKMEARIFPPNAWMIEIPGMVPRSLVFLVP